MTARVIVCDQALTTGTAREVLGRCDVDSGVLACVAPDKPGPSALAAALLDALGATGSWRRVGRLTEATNASVLPWMLAYGIKHLLLHRADKMPLLTLRLAMDVASASGATLWLTGQPFFTDADSLIGTQPVARLGRDEFTAAWTDATAAATSVAAAAWPEPAAESQEQPWPPMPRDDFPTFRSAMRDLLPPPWRERADTLFLATIAEVRHDVRPLLDGSDPTLLAKDGSLPGLPRLDRLELEGALARYLHTQVHRSSCSSELVLRMRAAQVATFHLGWLLQVSDARLTATCDEPSRTSRKDPRSWRALRMFRYPHQGAVCVLTGLDLDGETILTLPASAVALDGSTVTVQGRTLTVPDGAEPLLRAQLFSGQLAGRTESDPFLHVDGEPLTYDRARATVRAALLDAGVLLLSRQIDDSWNGTEWMLRWGIAIRAVS